MATLQSIGLGMTGIQTVFGFFDKFVAPLFRDREEIQHATALKVVEEATELLEIISHEYEPDPAITEEVLIYETAKEMADVIACCFLWARVHDIDLGRILYDKMELVGSRKQERTPQGTWHHVKGA